MSSFTFGALDIFLIVLVVLAIVLVFMGVRTVEQGFEYTVERFGRFTRRLTPGLHILVPFMDSVRYRINMRERVLDVLWRGRTDGKRAKPERAVPCRLRAPLPKTPRSLHQDQGSRCTRTAHLEVVEVHTRSDTPASLVRSVPGRLPLTCAHELVCQRAYDVSSDVVDPETHAHGLR